MKNKLKLKSKVKPEFANSVYSTRVVSGRRYMICQNSESGGPYFKGKFCGEWTLVGNDTSAVLCHKCTASITDAPVIRSTSIKSDRPKGWKFMKEFVAVDGTVYHKGVEQPELKGTLPVTVIEAKPEKKKLSKQEKESAKQSLGKEIEMLKAKLIHETRKGKKAEIVRSLSKANRQLKKLM